MAQILTFAVFLFMSLIMVIWSADHSIRYSTKIAKGFALPKYIIGFLVVAVLGVLPEAFIAISSALKGIPEFGLGIVFGSNVADMTFIFALVILISQHNLKVESKIIKDRMIYISVLALPIILGLNGYYSRLEGIIMIITGIAFYLFVVRKSGTSKEVYQERFSLQDIFFLLVSMVVLLYAAHLSIKFSVNLAKIMEINPVLIGMFVIGIGTTLPELFFSIRALKNHHDSLALGDILGIVVIDATIVLGTVAVLKPFSFNPLMVYVTGVFMILAVMLLFFFMKSGRILTRKEAVMLLVFYIIFIAVELSINAGSESVYLKI